MRAIDADELIKSIKNTADLGGWIGEALYQIKQVAIKYIDAEPSIDIVRCKDCKYKRLYDGEIKYYYCALEGRPNRNWSVADWIYCYWGEKEGE